MTKQQAIEKVARAALRDLAYPDQTGATMPWVIDLFASLRLFIPAPAWAPIRDFLH